MTGRPQGTICFTISFKPWFSFLVLSVAGLAACSNSGSGSRSVDTGVSQTATGGVGGSSDTTTSGGSGGNTNDASGNTTDALIADSGPFDANTSDGGSANEAGGAGSGGTSGAEGGGAGGTADTSSGETCEKGQIAPNEVIIMGESFYALYPYIKNRIEQDAKDAGVLDANASYRMYAESGTWLSRTIPSQFDTAIAAGPVKVVIMDGGGNDCMASPCDTCPDIFKTLLEKMAQNGVQDVIYTRYPEPGNPPGSNTTLKANLDILMPKMETVCAAATGLRCHWVDLRPVWLNGDTQDGLHPTASGGEHVGDLIWAEMIKDCIAQ